MSDQPTPPLSGGEEAMREALKWLNEVAKANLRIYGPYHARSRNAQTILAALSPPLAPQDGDSIIIRLRRAYDETGNALLRDALDTICQKRTASRALLTVLEMIVAAQGLHIETDRMAREAIKTAKEAGL